MPPLKVESAAGVVTTPIEMNGHMVHAVVLDPLSAEGAREAAGHQLIAPRWSPPHK